MKNITKAFLCLLLLLTPAVCKAQSAVTQEKDATTELQIGQAVRLMEKGETAKSRSILEAVLEKSPGHAVARYEMAYSYLLDKDYAKALEELAAIPDPESLGWKYYQLSGSLYDYLGQPDKTMEVFNKGLELYPHSGMLYLERGLTRQRRQQLNEALEDYEKGIEAEPMFASNYYRAAQLLIGSSEPVWGLMYGEIMLNLIPDHPRAQEICRLIHNAWHKHLTVKDSTVQIALTQDRTLHIQTEDSALLYPFPALYEFYFNQAASEAGVTSIDKMDFATFCAIRKAQILGLNAQPEGRRPPGNVLFSYLGRMIEAGHFETYMYHTFREEVPEAYSTWQSAHPDAVKHFRQWRRACPLTITEENTFCRSRYTYVDFVLPFIGSEPEKP